MFSQINNENEIINCLDFIESYTIYSNGNIKTIDKNICDFKKLTQNIKNLFLNARVMPAFGVSLHNDTIAALQSNSWIEINFCKELNINDLNFNSLLFKLEETYGINLIRKHNNKYDGRCIYLDFLEKVDLNHIISTT